MCCGTRSGCCQQSDISRYEGGAGVRMLRAVLVVYGVRSSHLPVSVVRDIGTCSPWGHSRHARSRPDRRIRQHEAGRLSIRVAQR